MPALKIFGKRIGGPKEEDMSKRISKDDKIAPNFDVPKRASRVDFSEMTSRGPNMGKVIRPRRMPVPMKEGEYGNVNREGNPEAIGPDMGRVNREAAKAARDFTATEMAQNLMSPGYNKMKKGGAVKSKKMSSNGKVKKMSSGGKTSQLAKANGCAVRGKSKGRIV